MWSSRAEIHLAVRRYTYCQAVFEIGATCFQDNGCQVVFPCETMKNLMCRDRTIFTHGT